MFNVLTTNIRVFLPPTGPLHVEIMIKERKLSYSGENL